MALLNSLAFKQSWGTLLAILACAPVLQSQSSVPFHGQIIGSAGGGRILYAATGPGYFKSIDDGATWSPVYVTESGAAQPPFAAFAVDPLNESNLFLATSPSEGAFWKSTNAGLTWRKANAGLPDSGPVTQSYLLVANNGAVYLRIDTAIYKSRDGGESWTRLGAPLPGNDRAFDINRGAPNQMFYGSNQVNSGSAIWKSIDEGATWRAVASIQTGFSGIGCIATEPQSPDVVYVCVAGGGNPAVNGVHISTNGGSSFSPPTLNTQPVRLLMDHIGGGVLYTAGSTATICRSQSRGSFTCIPNSAFVPAVRPTTTRPQYVERRNGNILHAIATLADGSGDAMYRTLDAGQSFQLLRGVARVTFAKTSFSMAMAPDVEATAPVTVSVSDLPGAAISFTAAASGEPWFTVNQTSGRTPASLTVTFRSEGLAPGSKYEGSIRLQSPQADSVTIPVVLEVTKPVLAPAPQYSFAVLAGNGRTEMGADGALAAETSIGDVSSLAVDRDQNVFFIATAHNRIRRVNASGVLSTLTGSGATGSAADGAPLLQAPLNRPESLTLDSRGGLYFSESGGVVRRISGGVLSTIFRSGQINATGASLLAVDPRDRLWLANLGRFFLNVPNFAPQALSLTGANLRNVTPGGMAFDAQGNLYVTQTAERRIYKITAAGVVSIFAGNGTSTISEGVPALATGMDSPTSLAIDARGNLLYVESRQAAIRLINPAGIVYTIAKVEGMFPRQIATDSQSNVYVSGSRYLYRASAPPLVIPTPAPPARNLASGEEALSPGTLFSLTGENLAVGDETIASGQNWPRELAGASVTVNGVAALLSHASPGRITGQIPPILQPGDAKLVVTVNGVSSPALDVPLALASPGIFTMPDDPEQAAGAEVSGSEAVVLVTGFGPWNEQGSAALGFKVLFDEMEIDGIEIVPAPGTVGVGRAKFTLPEGVEPGSHTVRILIGDAGSNTVRITVDR